MNAINYLLHTKTASELQLGIDEPLFAECKMHLIDTAHWLDFQNRTLQEIAQAKTTLEHLKAEQLEHAFEQLKQLERREKAIHEINDFLHDIERQKKIIMADEAASYFHDVAENVVDIQCSADEIVLSAQSYTEHLNQVDASYETTESLSSLSGILHTIPLINEFTRGINYLRDAYHAYQDKEAGQRKTKIAASIFGGLVSLGSFIVSALLLGSVGLLATASAIMITPIVIASAAIGVCAAALYRDGYILHQATQQADIIEKKYQEIVDEIKKTKEAISLQHADNAQEKMQADPRLARLGMQSAELRAALQKLNFSRQRTRRNIRFSAIALVGLGLALTAICLTGVGALITSVFAAATFIGVASIRIRDAYVQRRNSALAKKTVAAPLPAIHNSELAIEKKLLHQQEREVKQALIQHAVSLEKTAEKKPVITERNITATPAKTLAHEEDERESETETGKKPKNIL